jgi:hypothetical protein
LSRLAADLWVSAYRLRLERAGIPCMVSRRGDATAGSVLVKLATLDGAGRLYGRSWDAEGRRVWALLAEGPEPEVDAAAARQVRVDPDLWLLEIEDRRGRTLLDEPGLAE